MASKKLRPRCTIEIVNVHGQVVPILNEGASITPGTKRTKYREYWTEEEDLSYVYRQPVTAPDGSASSVDWPTGVHGNIGYDFVLAEATGRFVLRIDYFTVLPGITNGCVDYAYEPKSTSISGLLGHSTKLRIDVEWQGGFSEDTGRPDFKYLRVTCK